jgi:hypothetical protein
MTDNPIIPDSPDIPAEDDSIPLGGDESGSPIIVKSTESKLPEVSDDSTQEAEDEEPSEDLQPRLERLGGEPAPDITPEEFARLQQSGQIHIDPRGRVRSTARSSETDAGVSLRKRRAWYH